MDDSGVILSPENSIQEILDWLQKEPGNKKSYYIVSDEKGKYSGIVSSSQLYSRINLPEAKLITLIEEKQIAVETTNSLRTAIETMAHENIDVLPVLSPDNQTIVGILSYAHILSSYKIGLADHKRTRPISLRRKRLKLLIHGQKIRNYFKSEENTNKS